MNPARSTPTSIHSSAQAPSETPRRKKRRRLTRREAVDAAARFRTDAQGQPVVLRFKLTPRIEHVLLILSFSTLAVTGLAQRYAATVPGALILSLLGGIETSRQIHHLFAVLFFLETVFHFSHYIYGLFVHQRPGSMWPGLDDVRHFVGMIRYNLGLSREHPHFGRYTFEEKAEYWALIWGTLIMGVTGVMQWFPTITTSVLPGAVIPVARSLHGWEAVLAVLAILVWHTYHVVIKQLNTSIFTGTLTLEEMRTEHPAELEYLQQAVTALENAGGSTEGRPAANQEQNADSGKSRDGAVQ